MKYRIIADLHIGAQTKAAYIEALFVNPFIKAVGEAKKLKKFVEKSKNRGFRVVLLGDIIDSYNLNEYWFERVYREKRHIAKEFEKFMNYLGKEVEEGNAIYVLGNHEDEDMLKEYGINYVYFVNEEINGKKYLMFHGDILSAVFRMGTFRELDTAMLSANQLIQGAVRGVGVLITSLEYLIPRYKKANVYRAVHFASKKFDGDYIIMGHAHPRRLRMFKINDGGRKKIILLPKGIKGNKFRYLEVGEKIKYREVMI